MGNPIPPQPPDAGFGDDCLHCFAAGKTPNYVYIRFWDIAPCGGNPPAPNGMTFICAQDLFFSCLFYAQIYWSGFRWNCHYYFDQRFGAEHFATIQLSSPDTPQPLYYFEKNTPCSVDFSANLNTCPPNAGTGGHAHVQVFVPPIIILLTSGYHFVTTPGVLYEIQEVGMDHQLVHLANRYDKTNVLIYVDEEELLHD